MSCEKRRLFFTIDGHMYEHGFGPPQDLRKAKYHCYEGDPEWTPGPPAGIEPAPPKLTARERKQRKIEEREEGDKLFDS